MKINHFDGDDCFSKIEPEIIEKVNKDELERNKLIKDLLEKMENLSLKSSELLEIAVGVRKELDEKLKNSDLSVSDSKLFSELKVLDKSLEEKHQELEEMNLEIEGLTLKIKMLLFDRRN